MGQLVQSVLPNEGDTIVALATPPGRGALAVVRLSGPSAFAIAGRVVDPWPLRARYAMLCRLREPSDFSLIDRCVVSVFPAPHSYSGEDTVEFSTHGGHAVPEAVVSTLLRMGAREAQPGEFTRRALLNGKMDLLQAEAIAELIDARSDSMRQVALTQLDGSLSRQVAELRNNLLDLEALLAYDIDFPEEDHGPISHARISDAAASVHQVLDDLLDTAPATDLLRTGAVVVVAGKPNVGKSSLFNALVGQKRAIVTDVPGTTRDAIEALVQLGSWPLLLVDTAGLRPTADVVERLGIEVSEHYISAAHVVLACDDDPQQLHRTVEVVSSLGPAPVIPVLTKVDLTGSIIVDAAAEQSPMRREAPVCVSARTRRGIDELGERIADVLTRRYGSIPVIRPALTRTRQRVAVETARSELREFQHHWALDDLPTSVAAVHVRAAAAALDELIGAVDVEDVLGRIFATFCVGK